MSTHGGSAKGRVIGSTATRGKVIPLRGRRTGTCAWCGYEIFRPRESVSHCPNCAAIEIDWEDPPTPVAPVAHQHIRDDHVPGSIAFGMLGGFVRGRYGR